MATKIGVFVLSILICKIQSQAIEVNTNLQYSQISIPSYPSFTQNPLPNQFVKPASAPVTLPAPPPPVQVNVPPPQYLPSQVPISIPAQQYLSTPVYQPPPVSVALPNEPYVPPPTVTFPPPLSLPVPQPIQPTAVTLPAPLPIIQVSPPPPKPILPAPVYVNPPPPIAIQELPVSVNLPTVIPSLPTVLPSPVVMPPPQIPMITTTVVDNSLANKLANILQLFLASKTIVSNINPYCNSQFFGDVTPLYDAIGTIGTAYSPISEVVTGPFYSPAYGVTDISVPNIYGVESYGTVTDILSAANIGALSEVVLPYGDYFYSPLTSELILPTQLGYNFPQIVEPVDQVVYY